MATPLQISCIHKRQHSNPHERIEYVGGIHNGRRWLQSENDAIRDALAGKWDYFTSVNGRAVKVIVAVHNNRYYLKTQTDDYAPNNLLNLTECPR